MHDEMMRKECIDSSIDKVRLQEQMKDEIRKRNYRIMSGYRPRRWKRLATLFISIVLALSSILMGMSSASGFNLFFSESELDKLGEERVLINKENEKAGVKLVVEEVIQGKYQSCIALSFINETDTPWPSDVMCENLEISPLSGGVQQEKKILRGDGKKLTYLIEKSWYKTLTNKEISVKATNLITYGEDGWQDDERPNIIAKGTWCVSYNFKENKKLNELNTQVKCLIKNRKITEVRLSALGIQLKGQYFDAKSGKLSGQQDDEPQVEVIMKDGQHINLSVECTGGISGGEWVAKYIYRPIDEDRGLLEVEKIKEISINGNKIRVAKD